MPVAGFGSSGSNPIQKADSCQSKRRYCRLALELAEVPHFSSNALSDTALTWTMQDSCRGLLAATLLFAPCIALNSTARTGFPDPAVARVELHTNRATPYDLELSGDLAGLPSETIRYVTRDQLLALPQETYTVTGDPNFAGPTRISGVALVELIRFLSGAPDSDLIVAMSDDQYHAHYLHAYMEAHHPLLVLTIDGKPPANWPKDAEGHGSGMGPYMISHPGFTPGFKVLSHDDEAQIPWGVVRVEFRNEKSVLGSIAPHGPHAVDPAVQSGYLIAQQNCFRCHNMGANRGQKAGHPWMVLSVWATASPEYFAAYVRDPRSKNPHAQMPGNPEYDDATLHALADYFRTFSSGNTGQKDHKP
jgi:mono/diheme cytochrome c family protein